MTVVRARVLTPVTPSEVRDLPDAVVAFDAGRITEVTPFDGRQVDHDLRPGLLMPGFVDAHLHYPQTRIIGSASGPLLEWLKRSTFPEEERFARSAHAAHVAQVFATCLASAGTTLSMVYGSVHAEATHQLFTVLDQRGLRAMAGPVLMDAHSPESLMVPVKPAMDAMQQLISTWHGHDDGRLQVAVIPRFALSCSPEMLRAAGELSATHHLWTTTHLSENLDECAAACARFGTDDYLQIYEDAGLVHERSVYAHCVHLSDSEWDRFATARAIVAHCPDSNYFLGSGNMPTAAVLDRGIGLALGTDVAAGRTFRIPSIASRAYDNGLQTGLTLDPAQLLWWATRGSALALGQDHVGALEVGLEADMVWVDLPEWVERTEQVLACLLFGADGPHVRRTWVRGKTVWDRAAWAGAGAGYPWWSRRLE